MRLSVWWKVPNVPYVGTSTTPKSYTCNDIQKLESHFNKMKVTRGDHHVFLGMHINYHCLTNTTTISMCDYLTEAITKSSLSITHTASTPAGTNLFIIDESSPSLS
jgi:hypothetical protein